MAVLKNRYEILHMVKDKLGNGIVCAEVGVLRGQFSRWINETIQPKELHLIDSWGKHLESFTDYKTFTPQHWIDIMNKVQAKLPKAKLYRMLSIEGATKFQMSILTLSILMQITTVVMKIWLLGTLS